jgi:hypothetical protein
MVTWRSGARTRPDKPVVDQRFPRYRVAYGISNSNPSELESFSCMAGMAGNVGYEAVSPDARAEAGSHGAFGLANDGARGAPL